MKYRRYIIIPFILLVVLLSGCTTQYEQKDVYRYLKKTYALKDVKVSKEPMEFTGEDGYVDYIWEVTSDDITFHVKNDYSRTWKYSRCGQSWRSYTQTKRHWYPSMSKHIGHPYIPVLWMSHS